MTEPTVPGPSPSHPRPNGRAVVDETISALRTLLADPARFVRLVELVTTRGSLSDGNSSRQADLATGLAERRIADAVSITDNAGGHPNVSPETLGRRLLDLGQEVIIHLSCKDLNRNGLESRAWTLASEGFDNILALTGDYPVDGYGGQAAPVFDLDSVSLLQMLDQMNQGLRIPRKGGTASLARTDFLLGAVVSPFKQRESELMPQYYKLASKIARGARFIITQIGYDARKWDELLKYAERRGWTVPFIANVYVLSAPAARFFHRGLVPGVVVTDALLEIAEKQAASRDRGRAFFHELAAKQIAIARGMGYRGAYLGGHLKPEDVESIFRLADSFGPDDWRAFAGEVSFAQPNEFYFFEPDPATGLSSTEVNRAYLATLAPEARTALRRRAPLAYRLNRVVHDAVFEEGSGGFAAARRLYERVERAPLASRWLHVAEQAAKIPLFGCHDCGDCSLPEIAYLCPESDCAKNQRNGPCGGTRQGLCEVADKECIWSSAYDRLKAYGEEEGMLDFPPVLRDGRLRGSSAWSNRFLQRDHVAKRSPGVADDD